MNLVDSTSTKAMDAQLLTHYSGVSPQHISRSSIGIVLVAHGLLVFGLLSGNTISPPSVPTAVSVRLLSPTIEIAQAKPEIVPPKPMPVARKSQPTPTLLAAPAESPAATPVTVPPAPTFSEPAVPVAAPPAPVQTQPRFDADYLSNPKPPYPGISRRLGEQGRVVLRVLVAADGLTQSVQLHTSCGYARLDDAALETVRRWKFVPAKLGNEPVAATVLVPIIFSLKG